MSQPSLAAQLFTPLAMIMIGVAFGILLTIPARRNKGISFATAAGWAVSSGAAMWIIAIVDHQQLAKFPLFSNFSRLISNTQYSKLVFGDLEKTAAATLIGLYELGLILGFAAFYGEKRKAVASQHIEEPPVIGPRISRPSAPLLVQTVGGTTSVVEVESNHSAVKSQNDSFQRPFLNQFAERSNPNSLDADERTVVELYLFGNTKRIVPCVDVSKPEGYYFEGAPLLKLETGKLRQVLDSLVRKNILVGELEDKMLVCKECGSPNLQLRSMCPECKSMRLSKHNILEHFSCGLIEKQESFRTNSGDLVCPKCNVKLHLVGSDYRNLSQMYVCSVCNALNKDLLQQMKCGECGTIAQVGEESEEYLYAYSLNETAATQLGDQIKPIEACSTYFRSQGYVVVSPAFVSGKSGTRHTFDLLVLDSSQRASVSESVFTNQFKEAGSTVVEMLVSTRPIEIADITRVYGKICDIDCNSMIFAVPALTNDARQYAEQFKIKVLEGASIEEALRKSQIASSPKEHWIP